MLVDMKTILIEATQKGYGIVAPNVSDGNTIKACFEAALETRSPMVIDAGGKLDYDYLGEVTRYYSNKYPQIPVALNLDHGKDLDQVITAIKAGFTSVMIDKSSAPFEENVKETAEVVRIAHKVGVSVEAELGHVGIGNEYDNCRNDKLTMPEDVVKFVQLTGVDCLAIAIGTAHGHYSGVPYLDFDRLDQIRKVTDIPLVLHGGSSTGDENLKQAIKHGISKINIGTDLGAAAYKSITEFLASHDPKERFLFNRLLDATFEGWKNMLIHYLTIFDEKNRW